MATPIGDVFPKGPMRPAQGVQRGSVADMPTYPGDPLTPGVGATKDAKRLALADAKTITKIPVLPISYADAQPLLAALGGPVVPPAWRGGLPITYRFGPGPAKVHLRVKSDWSLKTAQRRHRENAGHDRSGPVGDSRKSPRRVGERRGGSDLRSGRRAGGSARARNSSQTGMAPEADDHLRRVGRRRAGAARIDRMGGDSRRRAGAARRRLHQQRHQRPRLPRHRRIAFAREVHQRSLARRRRSGDEAERLQSRQASHDSQRLEGRQEGRARARRPAHRRTRLRLRLFVVPRSHGRRRPEPRLRRRGQRRHLPLDVRRLLLVHALQRHQPSSTARRSRRLRALE